MGCGLQCIYCCALQAFTLAGAAPPWCHITGRVVRYSLTVLSCIERYDKDEHVEKIQ